MARIKGAALREFLLHWERRSGPGTLVSVASALPTDLQVHFDRDREALGVLDSNWVPAEAVHALLDGIVGDLGPDERAALARDGARAVLAATLRGVYRLLFRTMMSPERYARRAQSFWDRFYDSGRIEKVIGGPTEHHTTIRDWAAHHPVLCDVHMASAQFLYEAMGCRDVVAERSHCISRGAPVCAFVVRWKE